jgi:ATP phosphoribosyltransferase regulatory subunit
MLTSQREAELVRAAIEACESGGANVRLRLGDVSLFTAAVGACGLGPVWTRRLTRGFASVDGLMRALAKANEAEPPAKATPLAEALAALSVERAEAAVAAMLKEAHLPLLGKRGVPSITARLRAEGAASPESPPSADIVDFLRRLIAIDDLAPRAIEAVRDLARAHDLSGALDSALARAQARADAIGQDSAWFSPGFGRGLAYYDGFLFELESASARLSLGGGGRYDALIGRIASVEGGGPQEAAAWGAMGFALRPACIAEAAA